MCVCYDLIVKTCYGLVLVIGLCFVLKGLRYDIGKDHM